MRSRRAAPSRAAAAGLLAAFLAVFEPVAASGKGASPPRLDMEELEVRGARAVPGTLYVPTPPFIVIPSPPDHRLLRDDRLRPVPPGGGRAPTPNPGGDHAPQDDVD